MASKICGVRTGVAKQATVISAQHVESLESIFAGLHLVLNDIHYRQGIGQAMPGRTVLSMSFAVSEVEMGGGEQNYNQETAAKNEKYMQSLLQVIMVRGVVCVCSAGNEAETEGFAPTGFPSILATDAFPLISVGAVDITGTPASFSQQGVVYTVGVNSPCAAFRTPFYETTADGTSGGELFQATL